MVCARRATMTKRNLLAAALLSQLALVACASDPKKNADDARNAELQDQRKTEEKSAERRADQKESAAEGQRMATENAATGSSATQDRVEADAKLKQARDVYRANATERLEKADAKTREIKAKLNRAGNKAPTATRDSLKTLEAQRALVQTEMDKLPSTTNDNWEAAKSRIDAQLVTLETFVSNTATAVDKVK